MRNGSHNKTNMKKLKIIIITQDYPPPMGGIQTYVYNLKQELVRANQVVRILNYDGRNINNFRKLKLRDFPISSICL